MEHYYQENQQHRGMRVLLQPPPETPLYSDDASRQFFVQVPFSQAHRPQKPAFLGIHHGVRGLSMDSAGEISDLEPMSGLSLLSEEGEGVGVKSSGSGAACPMSRPHRSGRAVGASSDASYQNAMVSSSGAPSKSGDDSSTRSISSMAVNWVPDEIKRYFRNYDRNNARSSLSPRGAWLSCKGTLREREFRRFTLARNTLLAVLAVAVMPLLVGIAADAGKTLWGSGADKSAQMNLRRYDAQAAGGAAGKPTGDASLFSKSAPSGIEAQDNDLSVQATGTAEEQMGTATPMHEGQELLNEDRMSTHGDDVSPTKPRIQETLAGDSKHRARITSVKMNNVPERSRCGAFAFTYCQTPRPEFYYKQAENVCVPVATDHVGLCSRGLNRFTSKKSCREACIETKSRPQHCLVGAVFEKCERKDVRREWWHFDGHACHSWNFTSGLCPSYRSEVFTSKHDCLAKCSARTGKLLCRAATPGVCYSDHLRFPYFVVPDPEACLRVSAVNHLGRRCLTGPNRFESMAACQRSCVTKSLRD